MQNEEGQNMDLYIPRKCSATNRLITAKDHASVQLNVGHLDDSGVYTGTFTTFALCGFVRAQVIFCYPSSNHKHLWCDFCKLVCSCLIVIEVDCIISFLFFWGLSSVMHFFLYT